VTARTSACDGNLVWVDSIGFCVVANESYCAADLLEDFRDFEFWLCTVHHLN